VTESCSTTVRECSVVAQPLTVNITESAKFPVRHRVGKVKRKSKGREYVSPRILLSQNLKRHVGRNCLVFECRGSVLNSVYRLEDKDVLVVVLLP